jgi:hypothetical protein
MVMLDAGSVSVAYPSVRSAKSIDDAPATSGDDDRTRGWLLAIKYF